MCQGEVLPIHIDVSSPTQSKQALEEGLLSALKNVISMISLIDLPDHLSDDERSKAASLLQELQAVIVGAQFVHSIQLLTYISTGDVLDTVDAMFTSGHLEALLQQLFQCLTAVDDLTVAVSIKADDLQDCRDEFLCVGKSVLCCFIDYKSLPVSSMAAGWGQRGHVPTVASRGGRQKGVR